MIRSPNTGRHFKHTLSLTFSLAGLIFLIVLPGGLFWEFNSPIDQGNLLPNRGDTSVPPVPRAAARVLSDTLLAPDARSKARVSKAYGQLPLSFELNQGQVDRQVRFTSRGSGYSLFLTETEAVLALRASAKTVRTSSVDLAATHGEQAHREVLRMKLLGANAAPEIKGVDEQPGKSNYFIGNDPQKWQTNVAHYARVLYTGVYPGVDLVYYGNQRQLEYDFMVAPGIDPKVIKLSFDGLKDLRINTDGDLILRTANGEVRQQKPIVYQEIGGERREVAGRYETRDGRAVGFALEPYDTTKPLVIDPVLSYSTYLGGAGDEAGSGIVVDAAGNAYITGFTSSANFPTVNPLPIEPARDSVFITKLNAAGSALIYSTYLGGTDGPQRGLGIALDSASNVYVTGFTASTDFPTVDPLQSQVRGFTDAFVTKLNFTGSTIVYSTYLGGGFSSFFGDTSHARETGRGIAVDASGSAYVTGETASSDFPLVSPIQSTYGGGFVDGFAAKLNSAGSSLVYSTYIGGGDFESGNSIAVGNMGEAHVTGYTSSLDFPTANPLQPDCHCLITSSGSRITDAFVTKLNPAGSAFVYSTYLGGHGGEEGSGIATDSAGNAYVTGSTNSSNFPTANPFQSNLAPSGSFTPASDAFLSKLNPSGSALIYSTYLGGAGSGEGGKGIAVDVSGNAYITGTTSSASFPTVDSLQPSTRTEDVFVSKLNAAGSALAYSTLLGGGGSDSGTALAIDSAGNAYVAGQTSGNFPTEKPFQPGFGGGGINALDAFVAKIGNNPILQPTVLSILSITPNRGGNNGSVSVTVHGSGFADGATIKLTRAGQPDIVASPVGVSEDGSTARAGFDLTNQTAGIRDVRVTNPSGASITLAGAFTVEEGGRAQIWVDIIGRDEFRPGRPQTYYIAYGNRGNLDASLIPLFIAIPKEAEYELGFKFIDPPQPVEGKTFDFSQVPAHYNTPTEKMIPLFIGFIPAGSANYLKIRVIGGNKPLRLAARVRVFPRILFSASAPSLLEGKSSSILQNADGLTLNGLDSVADGIGCASTIFRGVASCGLGFIPGGNITQCELAATTSTIELLGDTTIGAAENYAGGDPNPALISLTQTAALFSADMFNCALGELPGVGTAIDVINCGFAANDISSGCFGFDLFGEAAKIIGPIFSIDPNDKIGPTGVGQGRYLSGEEPLRYAIYFENKPEATAPAQDVVITDQLDASKLDFDTFSLGPISFGADQTVVPPPGLSEFKTDVDLRPANNLIVRIEAKLDKTSGLLTWRFTSLDSSTGLPTEDTRAGFLPPNVVANEGEGQVLFTVRPKEGLTTGREIRNRARIVFDTNAPIDTPEWLNTIDYSKPTSHVSSLATTQNSNSFTLGWSGTDTGSGIQSYTIFVTENGGPFNVWQQDTVATSGIFTGRADTIYSFYSVARDRTGNQEDAPASADATTRTLPADTTAPVLTLPSTTTREATGPGGAVVTYTASATDDRDGSPTISCTPNSAEMFPLGPTMVTCTATDAAGNRAQASFLVNVVDTRAPTITTLADMATNATSPAGATVSYTAPATDIVDTTLTLTCSPASGSMFEIGQTVVTCTAVDDSGNRASRSFRVTVRGAADQLTALVALVRSFNLHHGTENSLLAQLQSAGDALRKGKTSAACGPLNAFSNHVRAQDAKKISGTQANQMLAAANQIGAVVGCR